jgi:holliday junction DNA helicase RuvA
LIAYLSGKLFTKSPNLVVIDVGGVGYEVAVPLSTFYILGEEGSSVTLRIHTHVREDALQLFGFGTEQEKRLFLQLTSVSGIGPKLGITILSGMNAEELVPAIRMGNLARLVSIPGVGKKMAERLVVELKDKVSALSTTGIVEEKPAGIGAGEDVISALVNLGYARPVAEKAVKAVLTEAPAARFAELVRLSLQKMR